MTSDGNTRIARISALETKIDNIENELSRIREEQKELKEEQKELKEDMNDSNLCVDRIDRKVSNIESILEKMSARKIKLLDIVLIIIGLLITGISAYAAIRNNQLTQIIIDLSKKIKP